MRDMVLTFALVVALVGFTAGAETTYSWQADGDGNYSGSFTNAAHWSGGIVPGSGYPVVSNFNQVAKYPIIDADYTVTLPEGVVTNLSSIYLCATYGHKVTFDGSKTTLVFPTVDGNVYGKWDIRSAKLKNGQPAIGPQCFKRYSGDGKTTGVGTFKNFKLSVASHCDDIPGTVITLTGENIDWKDGSVRLFADSNEADGSLTAIFKDGYSPAVPQFQFGFVNYTNVLTFSNYRVSYLGMSYFTTLAGTPVAADQPGIFEWNFLNGSVVESASYISLGYDDSSKKTFRINVKDASSVTLPNFYCYRGHNEINVLGEGSELLLNTQTQYSDFGNSVASTTRVCVADGAYLLGAGSVYLGGKTAATAAESFAELVVSNATVAFKNGVTLHTGACRFVDGASVIFVEGLDGNTFQAGGWSGVDTAFWADGATFHFRQGQTSAASTHKTRTMIKDFTSAKVGPKGLVLSAEWSWYFIVPQNFSDWDSDHPGTIYALGYSETYPLELTGTDSRESNLVIAQSFVKLATDANHYSNVIVTNGATWQLSGGAKAPQIRSLTLGDDATVGTLSLDTDTEITVDGAINFVNPEIAFASDLSAGTNTIFRQTVEPTDETVVMWEVFLRGTISSGLPSGKYARLQVVRDGAEWLYQIVVADSAPALEGTTTWTGAGSSSWNDDSNWADGQPDATHAAAFGGTAAQTVTVSGTVDAGGISFGNAEGTTLTGGRLRISDNSSAAITATAGTNTIASQVQMTSRVAVPVAEGAQVTVSGEVIGGGFAKSGAGRLVVENAANRFADGFGLNGGWFEFTSLGAFGYVFSTTVSDLISGTLEYTGEAGATPIATAISGPVVYKPESELTMKLPSATAGAIVKRGAGRLVFDVATDATLTLDGSKDGGLYTRGNAVTYPADGSAPATHPSVSVNEGELVFRGSGETVPKVTIDDRSVSVGVPVAEHSGEVGLEPGLVIDHAHLYLHNGILAPANGLTAGETFAREPYLIITNGGVVTCSLQPNRGGSDALGARVFADKGTIISAMSVNVQDAYPTTNHFLLVNESLIAGSRHTFLGSSVMVFSNSVWASGYTWGDRSTLGACAVVNYGVKETSKGMSTLTDWTFADGSIFACYELEFSAPAQSRKNPHTIRFDNAEWWAGTGDETLATASLNVTTVLSGKGLLQQPSEGKTYTWITPVVGDGNFVKRGAGTVWFKPQEKYHAAYTADFVTLGYSGLTDIQKGLFKVDELAISNFVGRVFRVAGTLDLDGASVAGAVITTAGGAVTNATLVSPTLALEYDAEGTPKGLTLDQANGLALSPRVTVDFGVGVDGGRGATALPVGTTLTVATFTGTAPDLTRWRAKNVGDRLSARYSIQDNSILARVVRKKGLVMLLK